MRPAKIVGTWAICLGLVVLAALVWGWFSAAILHFTGTSTTHGQITWWYNFWSGFGSDFGEFALVASALTALRLIYKTVNCHEATCRRVGIFHLEAKTDAGAPIHYRVCHQHHPHHCGEKPSFATIQRHWINAHQEDKHAAE